MLHLSVMAYFRNAAERSWFFHMLVPALGLLVVLAVLSGMHAIALWVGCAWLFVGLLYGAYLNRQGRVVISV
jgi:hypothetical protein